MAEVFIKEKVYLYVAPNGDDNNPGRWKNHSLLLKSQRYCSRAEEKHKAADYGFLRGCIYYLDEPLALRSEDSGIADAPITYA
ncbi:MAG: hypothetical protein QXT26_06950 [Thermoproteota archaeon]